jgi:hypothetical protein
MVILLLQLHMGRHPHFCLPLLSNRCIGMVAPFSSPPPAGSEPCASSNRCTDIAMSHREELVAEVVEKEVDGNVPPRMEVVAEVQLVPEVEVVGSNVSRPRCMS